jgi:drug/metabolite transporter (DMT)-like permease
VAAVFLANACFFPAHAIEAYRRLKSSDDLSSPRMSHSGRIATIENPPVVWINAALVVVIGGHLIKLPAPWRLPLPGPTTWLAVIGIAILSTALAYIVCFQILRRSGATNVMLVTLLIPLTAILLGALVIGSALLVMDGRVLRLVR